MNLLPVANLAGLGWSVIIIAVDFRKRAFGVLGARHITPFGLCMAGCLVAYLAGCVTAHFCLPGILFGR